MSTSISYIQQHVLGMYVISISMAISYNPLIFIILVFSWLFNACLSRKNSHDVFYFKCRIGL